MSLITEKVQTVLQGQVVEAEQFVAPVWAGASLGRQLILQGTVTPRAIGLYTIADVNTGLPVQLPANALPIKMLFEPLTTLTAVNTNNVLISGVFGDLNFQNVYQPWIAGAWFTNFTATDVNHRAIFETSNTQASPSSFTAFPYVGVQIAGASLTGGSLLVTVYYVLP